MMKAIVFDLDGTLLDTAEDLGASVNAVLVTLQYPIHDQATIRSFIGKGIKEFVAAALPVDKRTEAEIAKANELVQQEYTKRWREHTHPFPQIPELLTTLIQKNIPIAVLSNKEEAFTKEIVATILSQWQFSKVVGSAYNIPPKPDPTLALKIAQELQIAPAEFLYVGDSDIDMETATRAGMKPIFAAWGYQTKPPAEEEIILLTNPLDLLIYL